MALTPEAVQFTFVALYAALAVGMAGLTLRLPGRLRRFGAALTGVVALAAVVLVGQAAGVGSVAVGAGEVDLLNLARNLVTYPVVYGGVALLGGASRRLAAGVSAVALLPVLAVGLAPAVGASALAVGVILAVVLPYPVLAYLLLGPVWRAAGDLPAERRLLYWKARNMLLFFYAMILAFVLLLFVGVVTDPALVTLLLGYSLVFFYGGVPAFLVYRFARLDDGAATAMAAELADAVAADAA